MPPALLLAVLLSGAVPAFPQAVVEARLDEGEVRTNLDPADIAVHLFLLPFAYAYALPHKGFERYPYEAGGGYGQGEREMAVAFSGSAQSLGAGRTAGRSELRVRGDNRLGWRAEGSWLPDGSRYTGQILANYLQSGRSLLELGLGVSTFRSRTGFSAELAFEAFPGKPWTASAAYGLTWFGRDPWHELSVAASAAWGRAALSVGYRAWLRPGEDASGPEAALRFWF